VARRIPVLDRTGDRPPGAALQEHAHGALGIHLLETHLIISDWAQETINVETGLLTMEQLSKRGFRTRS
jgi:hypothetical protein